MGRSAYTDSDCIPRCLRVQSDWKWASVVIRAALPKTTDVQAVRLRLYGNWTEHVLTRTAERRPVNWPGAALLGTLGPPCSVRTQNFLPPKVMVLMMARARLWAALGSGA